VLEGWGQQLRRQLERAPYLAVLGTGLAVFALGQLLGVGEVALAVAGSYVALRALQGRTHGERPA
jgi:hypothetical protein